MNIVLEVMMNWGKSRPYELQSGARLPVKTETTVTVNSSSKVA